MDFTKRDNRDPNRQNVVKLGIIDFDKQDAIEASNDNPDSLIDASNDAHMFRLLNDANTGHFLMIMTSELESALKLIGISKKITMLEDSLEADEYERRIYDLIYIDYAALINLM